MKISGKIIKKKAVVITPEYLEELCRLLLRFSEKLTFKATTYSDSEITFDDIHDLLCYDNLSRHRLKSLHIKGYRNYERTISLYIEKDTTPFSIRRYDRTIYGIYQFDSIDSETIFINEFEKWFEKIKSNYWLLSKFSVSGTIFVPSVIITFFRSIVWGPLAIDVPEDITGVLMILWLILIAGAIVVLAIFIDMHILENLFPAIVFCWGEETKRFEKWGRLRSNIFWGIIMAALVGLVTSYLLDTLRKV